MHVELVDKNTIMVGCNDRNLLNILQERLDGKKVYKRNQFTAPLHAGPKLFRFQQYGIQWDDETRKAISAVSANITRRKQVIREIKSQYGKDIDFNYDYKGIYPPMDHQKIIYNIMVNSDLSAILAEPGTCKTGPYLWAIDTLIQSGKIKKALIITLSTLTKNVLEEMSIQVPHLKGAILKTTGGRADKILNKKFRSKKRNIDYDIYIANYESMFTIVDLFDDDYFQMVILDEAHRIGSPLSRQTKSIIRKFEHVPRKTIVTGTLNANNCLSFFMPFRFLGPDTVPTADYYEFRRQNMRTVDPDGHIWKELPGTKRFVGQIIGNLSVFFAKDTCLDLPGVIYQSRYCSMDKDQEKYSVEIEKQLMTQIKDMCKQCNKYEECKGEGACDNEMVVQSKLVAIMKLQQIACGFYINTVKIINDDGKEVDNSNIITFDKNPKLNLLIETINNIPSDKKIIIWSQFTHVIDIIKDRLSKAHLGGFLTIYKNQDAFQQVELFKRPEYRFLIANPSKAAAGLNIQFSSYQIFYSNNYSLIQRDQAIGRQDRKGQTEKVTVIDLMCEKSIDEVVHSAVQDKKNMSDFIVSFSRLLKKKK